MSSFARIKTENDGVEQDNARDQGLNRDALKPLCQAKSPGRNGAFCLQVFKFGFTHVPSPNDLSSLGLGCKCSQKNRRTIRTWNAERRCDNRAFSCLSAKAMQV